MLILSSTGAYSGDKKKPLLLPVCIRISQSQSVCLSSDHFIPSFHILMIRYEICPTFSFFSKIILIIAKKVDKTTLRCMTDFEERAKSIGSDVLTCKELHLRVV